VVRGGRDLGRSLTYYLCLGWFALFFFLFLFLLERLLFSSLLFHSVGKACVVSPSFPFLFRFLSLIGVHAG